MEIQSYGVILTQEEIDLIYLVTGFVVYSPEVAPKASKALLELGKKLEILVSEDNETAYHVKLGVSPDLDDDVEDCGFNIVFKEDI